MSTPQDLLETLQEQACALQQATDRRDHAACHALFHFFRNTSLATYTEEFTEKFWACGGAQPLVDHIRPLLAQSECHQEKMTVTHFLQAKSPLDAFCCYRHNQKLIESESQLFKGCANAKACFVGSGALPMTGLAMAEHEAIAHVTCVDCDAEALAMSQQIIQHPKILFVEGFAEKHDYHIYDVIFVASLIPDKATILKRICETARHGTRIVARTVEGMRQLIYVPITPSDIPAPLKLWQRIAPTAGVVNNTLVFELDRP